MLVAKPELRIKDRFGAQNEFVVYKWQKWHFLGEKRKEEVASNSFVWNNEKTQKQTLK
jgi:hypothetical protein